MQATPSMAAGTNLFQRLAVANHACFCVYQACDAQLQPAPIMATEIQIKCLLCPGKVVALVSSMVCTDAAQPKHGCRKIRSLQCLIVPVKHIAQVSSKVSTGTTSTVGTNLCQRLALANQA